MASKETYSSQFGFPRKDTSGTLGGSRGLPRFARFFVVVASAFVLLAAGCIGQTGEPVGEGPEEPREEVADFQISLYQGQEEFGVENLTLSDLRGKPVVLNYWAGLCPPCRAEMPEFQEFRDDFEGRVTLVGVDMGQFLLLGSREDARKLLAELGVTYAAGFTDDPHVVEAHRVLGLPTTIFVTADGHLYKKWDGVLNLEKLTEIADEMLAEQGG